MKLSNIKRIFFKYRYLILFSLVTALGMYLRFFRIEQIKEFGWDQARDAWKVRDIIVKHIFVVNGPRTGVGHFHLGPLWYYLLVPFYLFRDMDPGGAIYLNFLVNLFNFGVIYWVFKKIFNDKTALFVSSVYSFNNYLISINQTAWNVSPVPGVAIIIFYGIYRVVNDAKYNWIYNLSFLTGLFFHLHFAVVFLPPIILLSLALVKEKKKLIANILWSIPLFFIWLIPEFIYEIQSHYTNAGLFGNFLKDYFINGFHLRFFIYRLHDAFIQYQVILGIPKSIWQIVFIIPLIYYILVFTSKNKKQKIVAYLISLWFFVPAFFYSFYGGTTSEYYMLFNSVLAIYTVSYILGRLWNLRLKIIRPLVVLMVMYFFFVQTKGLWYKKESASLAKQKNEVRHRIATNSKIFFNEGDIKSYLWQIWVEDRKMEK